METAESGYAQRLTGRATQDVTYCLAIAAGKFSGNDHVQHSWLVLYGSDGSRRELNYAYYHPLTQVYACLGEDLRLYHKLKEELQLVTAHAATVLESVNGDFWKALGLMRAAEQGEMPARASPEAQESAQALLALCGCHYPRALAKVRDGAVVTTSALKAAPLRKYMAYTGHAYAPEYEPFYAEGFMLLPVSTGVAEALAALFTQATARSRWDSPRYLLYKPDVFNAGATGEEAVRTCLTFLVDMLVAGLGYDPFQEMLFQDGEALLPVRSPGIHPLRVESLLQALRQPELWTVAGGGAPLSVDISNEETAAVAQLQLRRFRGGVAMVANTQMEDGFPYHLTHALLDAAGFLAAGAEAPTPSPPELEAYMRRFRQLALEPGLGYTL